MDDAGFDERIDCWEPRFDPPAPAPRERVRCRYCGGSGALPEQTEEGYTGREMVCFNCNGSGET